jgi:hypothetical protein
LPFVARATGGFFFTDAFWTADGFCDGASFLASLSPAGDLVWAFAFGESLAPVAFFALGAFFAFGALWATDAGAAGEDSWIWPVTPVPLIKTR